MSNQIKKIRENLGLTQQNVADRIGTSAQQVQRLEAGGRRLTVDWLVKLADAMSVDTGDLIADNARPAVERPGDEVAFNKIEPGLHPGRVDWIPIQSGSRGGDEQEMFWQDGLGYTPRPPSLANVRDGYSAYVVGTSMEPRYQPGWLLYINPLRPPAKGRAVVVRKKDGCVLVKLFVGWQGGQLFLEQLNPPAEIAIAKADVETVHLVVGTNEES